MSADKTYSFEDGKFCLADIEAALNQLSDRITDLETNPPEATVPGAVMIDGSTPMSGCLELPAGCLNDIHAVRWSDLREYFRTRF